MGSADSKATTARSDVVDDESEAGESCLVEIYGPGLGRKIPIDSPTLTIGRKSSNDVVLRGDNVSRQHCRVTLAGDRVLLEDMGSTNGTYLNDCLLAAGQQVELRSGDLVHVGAVIYKFLYGGNLEALYHEEIYKTTILDALTQIYNRRYFIEYLEREVSRSRRHAPPLSLILFDIDHFKQINDRLGHVAGDHIMRDLASLVGDHVRREDCCARYGGEQFVISSPETALGSAVLFAEKLRATIEIHPFQFEGQEVPVTISLGVALFDSSMVDAIEFVKAADARLYEAKDAGYNRVAS